MMTESQFNLTHGFFLALCTMLKADSVDRRKWEKETKAAAEMMDKSGIPFSLQNCIAAAAADGHYFPISWHRLEEVKAALKMLPADFDTLDKRRRILSVTLSRPVSSAEVIAASLQ